MSKKNLRVDLEKKELPVHIHQGFPIGIFYNQFTKETYDYIDWHWHDEAQYNIVISGKFCIQVANKEYIISEGDGIFINSQQIHKAEAIDPDSSYLFIYFNSCLLSNQKDSFLYKNYIAPMLSADYDNSMFLSQDSDLENKIIEGVLKIKSVYDKKDFGYELDILSILINVWKYTCQCIYDKGLKTVNNECITNNRLKNIFSFINENYTEQFSLEDISNHVNLSRSECCRFFKNSIGQTLFEYIIDFRINKSIELLLSSDKSIAEIAYEVGFNNQSYFTKCFTSIKNKTPKTLRNEYRNKEMEKKYLLDNGNI